MATYIYDIESYPNYFLAVFKVPDQDHYDCFTQDELDGLVEFLDQPDLILVGYNNHRFDDVLLKLIIQGSYRPGLSLAEAARRGCREQQQGNRPMRRSGCLDDLSTAVPLAVVTGPHRHVSDRSAT